MKPDEPIRNVLATVLALRLCPSKRRTALSAGTNSRLSQARKSLLRKLFSTQIASRVRHPSPFESRNGRIDPLIGVRKSPRFCGKALARGGAEAGKEGRKLVDKEMKVGHGEG